MKNPEKDKSALEHCTIVGERVLDGLYLLVIWGNKVFDNRLRTEYIKLQQQSAYRDAYIFPPVFICG